MEVPHPLPFPQTVMEAHVSADPRAEGLRRPRIAIFIVCPNGSWIIFYIYF